MQKVKLSSECVCRDKINELFQILLRLRDERYASAILFYVKLNEERRS